MSVSWMGHPLSGGIGSRRKFSWPRVLGWADDWPSAEAMNQTKTGWLAKRASLRAGRPCSFLLHFTARLKLCLQATAWRLSSGLRGDEASAYRRSWSYRRPGSRLSLSICVSHKLLTLSRTTHSVGLDRSGVPVSDSLLEISREARPLTIGHNGPSGGTAMAVYPN